jgi:hypothetical protein
VYRVGIASEEYILYFVHAESIISQPSFFGLSGSLSSTAVRRTCYVPDAQEHSDFIRFLSIAPALDVHVLPLTCQPGLVGLSEGATREIGQSPFNAEGGDLRQFLSSSFGLGISLGDRQIRCGEIAEGLGIVHQCGMCPHSQPTASGYAFAHEGNVIHTDHSGK